MNLENFHSYIDNPSLLYQITYQELKGLVLQYPFAANLRFLLWLKSYLEEHREEGKNLAMAAALAPDRRKLRQLRLSFESFKTELATMETKDDFLELKDLGTLETGSRKPSESRRMEAALDRETATAAVSGSAGRESVTEASDAMQSSYTGGSELLPDDDGMASDYGGMALLEIILGTDNAPPDPLETTENAAAENSDTVAESPAGESPPAHPPAESGLSLGFPPEVAPPADGNPAAPVPLPSDRSSAPADAPTAPLPKGAFQSWKPDRQLPASSLLQKPVPVIRYKRSQPPAAQTPATEPPAAPEQNDKQTEQEQQARQLARKSVQQDVGIVSETLAVVLERQQHFDKAVAMYRKLMVKHPERSDFFAGKIAELKARR